MAISIAQITSMASNDAFTSPTSATFSTNPTSGNLIVAWGYGSSGMTISAPVSGFTLIQGATNTSGAALATPFVVWGYATGGALSITLAGGQARAFVAAELTGAATSSPVGVQGASASVTSVGPTATTSGSVPAGNFVVTSYACGGGSPAVTTTTPPSGFTTSFNFNGAQGGGAGAHKIASAGTAESAVWPYFNSFSDPNSALIVSFLAAATNPDYYLQDIIEM